MVNGCCKVGRVYPNPDIIAWVHFLVISSHEDNFLVVDNAEPGIKLVVYVLYFCNLAQVLEGFLILRSYRRSYPDIDPSFVQAFKDWLQCIKFPYQALGRGNERNVLV